MVKSSIWTGKKPHKSLIVAPEIHDAMATSAREKKISTIEATYYVLKKALSEEFRYAEVEGLEASTPV
jgi:hypothetical protein